MERDPLLGKTLAGRYRLIARLGSGSMSAVYLSRHVLIERLSAIKVVHEGLVLEESHKDHFLREARAVNRINHPNIVEISDYGEATVTIEKDGVQHRRNVVYLVMEYVPGESLENAIERGPLPAARVLPIILQVASALARAHQTGVTHRDIKPDNILLVPRKDGGDVAKLTDFGVAKISQSQQSTGDRVQGTPGYIAPEYLIGETAIDGRADLYSLGVVMYEALTGAMPFEADGPASMLTRPLMEAPIDAGARVRDLPVPIERVVMQCLERRPDDRPRDAFALIEMLQAAASEAGITQQPGEATLPSGLYLARSEPAASAAPSESKSPIAQAIERLRAGSTSSRPAVVDSFPAAALLDRPSYPPPPRLGSATPAALVHGWRTHWAELEQRLRAHVGRGEVPRNIADAVHRRVRLTEGLDRAAAIVLKTQNVIDDLDDRARDFRATLGKAIDHVARDLSRAHAQMQAIKARRVELHLQRRNTADSGAADALLWEEASIDDELRKQKAITDDLGYQVGALQDELFRRNNLHETEVHRMSGALEGESAAMATLHRELELLSNEIVRYLASKGAT